ncbi:hypothetical protein K440DRAFT_48790 [Wilcoxina mikolae CBS 423.85]|nr:hypothetical protein K440DRAFT_48790 [Wilcoxina mikolae CBS 423.85]
MPLTEIVVRKNINQLYCAAYSAESLETSLSILLLFLSSASQYMVRLKHTHSIPQSDQSLRLLSTTTTTTSSSSSRLRARARIHIPCPPPSSSSSTYAPPRNSLLRLCLRSAAACVPDIFLCSFAVLSSNNPCPNSSSRSHPSCILYFGAQNVSNHHHSYVASTRFHSRRN